MSSSTAAVIGGSEAEEGAWPFVALLSRDDRSVGAYRCGAVVVGDRWVVTAGHCVDSPDNDTYPDIAHLRITVGRHDIMTSAGTQYEVASITEPENDYPSGLDIALLETTSDIGVEAVRLASPARMGQVRFGDPLTVLGWGATVYVADSGLGFLKSDELRVATVTHMGVGPVCVASSNYTSVEDHELCLGVTGGGVDTCSGDSGGPALVWSDGEYFLAGLVHAGHGCALPGYPGKYTYSASFFDWVLDNASSQSPSYLTTAQLVGTGII